MFLPQIEAIEPRRFLTAAPAVFDETYISFHVNSGPDNTGFGIDYTIHLQPGATESDNDWELLVDGQVRWSDRITLWGYGPTGYPESSAVLNVLGGYDRPAVSWLFWLDFTSASSGTYSLGGLRGAQTGTFSLGNTIEPPAESPVRMEGTTLMINGTNAIDRVSIDTNNGIVVNLNGIFYDMGSEAVASIHAELLGGNDRFICPELGSLPMYVNAGPGNDSILTGAGSDTVTGGPGRDTLRGGGAGDLLKGGASADRLYGESGKDRIYGGGSADQLDGGSGNDRLYGEAGDDVLDGRSGIDALYGGSGDDYLAGGAAADLLDGGAGDGDMAEVTSIDSVLSIEIPLRL